MISIEFQLNDGEKDPSWHWFLLEILSKGFFNLKGHLVLVQFLI
jgi:hypothetical protein